MSFKVKSLFEYSSGHDDDLPFGIGQIITVTEEVDDDWYSGEYVDDAGTKQEGMFPRNFVEKYEPVAPPRPTRTRPKKEPEPAAPEEPPAPADEPDPEPAPAPAPAPAPPVEQEEAKPVSSPPQRAVEPVAPVSPQAPKAAEPMLPSSPPRAPAEPVAQSSPKEAPVKRGPPPVTEKPATVSNSFKDRIAAFNKSSAPPIAPFKPSGLGGSGGSASFIKKPFVAPPPKGNTYVPTQRNAPVAPVYRREEDPEIKEREAENTENAQKAGLLPTETNEANEDEPKPMSLKERMALLQRQQQEQAARHAEAAAKKEKPKRPATKPRMLSQESAVESAADEDVDSPAPLERHDTGETTGEASLDEPRPPRVPAQPRRKPSTDPEPRDGNEADMSGAGETTDNQEEELTEREDSDEKPRRPSRGSLATGGAPAAAEAEEAEEEDEEEEDEEDEEAQEIRRKEELRARMARLGGGMGMPGMFGMPMPGAGAPTLPPKKKKASASSEKARTSEDSQSVTSPRTAPPVPTMMALPGMGRPKQAEKEPAAEEAEEQLPTPRSPPSVPGAAAGGAPPVPGGRPAPPPIPAESRPPPPPPPAPESEGSESGDELSGANEPAETPRGEEPPATRAPPPLPPVSAPAPPVPTSPRSPKSPKFHNDDATPISPPSNKRASRLPPPVPGTAAAPPSQTRPPPPPPPGGLPRTSTSNDMAGDEEGTDYEGDYDTDIGSSVPHKDALKHGRESSIEDTLSVASPTVAPPSMPPPIPSAAAPRAPPPLPSQPPPEPDTRRSVDAPRAAPPPPPPAPPKDTSQTDEYDPFNYAATSPKVPTMPSYTQPPPPPRRPSHAPSQDSYAGESSYQQTPLAPPGGRAPPAPRASMDSRPSRRSMDMLNRPSMDTSHVANDIDLAPQSGWWMQPNGLPPQLQGRKDLFTESEESTQPGQKTTRDIYVLYQDYSQTVITVHFNPQDANDVHLEQRHEGPPRSLRQDQLEESYERFGRPISEAVNKIKETVVGDGTPQGLVLELLKPFKDALLPVGTRAYGALVYSNLANASTTQTDQIRPGDIISIRNAKFQGKHGPMHAKYSAEVGKPDHVGVVAEWDGTKKKVRAWEQGRESKKVKMESFKLDDLRSGEVKIWRVMPRSWVGWEGQN
ncbi:assembly of actin patch protein [Gnomoniopsis sp. IMI 355080]|nr:assembly of actin patch protein [Gnomoniopsis sp. IMI 355080]